MMKKEIFRKPEKRDIYAVIFSGTVSAMLTLGREMTMCRMFLTPTARLALLFIGTWIGLCAVTLVLWRFLDSLSFKEPEKRRPMRSFIVFLIILAGFIPMWLISFPGTYAGDISAQLMEFEQGKISQSFPVLHTVFVGAFITAGRAIFGSYNGGIALAVFAQLVTLSAVLTYTVIFFDRRSTLPWAGAVLMLLYILCPVLQLYSKDLVRDTLFSVFALLSGFLLYSAVYETERLFFSPVRTFLFASVLLAMLFLRNSAIMLFAVELIIVTPKLIKDRRAGYGRCLAVFAAVLALWGAWSGIVSGRAVLKNSEFEGVAESGIKENLSVPIQQMMRASYLNWNTLPQEDRDTVQELFSETMIRWCYDDDCADIVKASFDQKKFKADWQRYLKEWLRLGMMYKRSYLEAFLVLNTEAFYPDTVLDGNDIYGDTAYYSDGTAAPGHKASVFPGAYERLSEFMARDGAVHRLRLLFAPAYMLYLLLFAAFYLLYKKGRGMILILPAIIIHLGTLFAPVASLRYYFASFISAAPAAVLVLSPKINNRSFTDEKKKCA